MGSAKSVLRKLKECLVKSEVVKVKYNGVRDAVCLFYPQDPPNDTTFQPTNMTSVFPTKEHVFETRNGEEIPFSPFAVPEELERGEEYKIERNVYFRRFRDRGNIIT